MGFDLTYEQRCEIYEKFAWVELFRGFMLGCVCHYTIIQKDAEGKSLFLTEAPSGSASIFLAKFLATLWMQMEVDIYVGTGISMMKYAVNHYENFVNPHAAFLAGFSFTIIGWATELALIFVLTNKNTPVDAVLAYTALSPISAPEFMFDTLFNHKITRIRGLEL